LRSVPVRTAMTHYQRQKETILQLIRATMDVATNQENEEVLRQQATIYHRANYSWPYAVNSNRESPV